MGETLSQQTIRLLGLAEVLGAVGLVRAARWSGSRSSRRSPPACLAALMVGATAVHVRRGELLPDALRTLALIVLSVVIAVYRFGPQAF